MKISSLGLLTIACRGIVNTGPVWIVKLLYIAQRRVIPPVEPGVL